VKPELHINIDHIATLRNARATVEPSPLAAVKLLEATKACGITIHLREDRRHIKDQDVFELDYYLRDSRLGLTFEMGATEEIRAICLKTKSHLATIVPEKRSELTTEGGLDVASQKSYLSEFIKPIQANGTKISMFVDPVSEQIQASKEIGADFVELHTGSYANLFIKYHNEVSALGPFYNAGLVKSLSYDFVVDPIKQEIDRLSQAVFLAQSIGLKTNLGHGLTIPNLPALISKTPKIEELHIGHSVIANSIYYGLPRIIEIFADITL
jgi:pyridoxine 5-phosphate synthase